MDCHEAQGFFALYLDGEMDARTALSLQGHVEDCPTCGGILAREIDLREVIRDHLSSVTAPAPFKRAVQKALRRQREGWVRFSRPWQVAAAIPILVLAVGAFVRFERQDLRRIVKGSAISHQLYGTEEDPLEFWAVKEDLLLPQYEKRLPFEVALPTFTETGAQLVGGRLCLLNDQQGAHTLYQRGTGRLSLFTIDQKGARLPTWGGKKIGGRTVFFEESQGNQVAIWEERNFLYTVVGKDLKPFLTKALRDN